MIEWTTFIGASYKQRVRCLRQLQLPSVSSSRSDPMEEEACFWQDRLLSDAGRRNHENMLYTRGGGQNLNRLLVPCVASCKVRKNAESFY